MFWRRGWRRSSWRYEFNDIGADIDSGNPEENPEAGRLFYNQMRHGLGTASLHLRRGVEVVHGFVQRRGFNGEYSKEAETPARADDVGFDQNEIICCQLYGGLFVHLQR